MGFAWARGLGAGLALMSVLLLAPVAQAQTAVTEPARLQKFPRAQRIQPMVTALRGNTTTNTIPVAQAAKQVIKPVTKTAATKTAAATGATAPAAPQTFVAYTCKIGQEYSVERKTCYTPGVTSATGRVASVRSQSVRASRPAAVSATRSSLGRKRQR